MKTHTDTETPNEIEGLSPQDAFRRFARPMIVRSVLHMVMSTADRLVAAVFIGAHALVATTLISPLMFLNAAVASLFISGAAAYIGFLLGRGETDRGRAIGSAMVIIMAGIGVALAIPSVVFAAPVADFLGARGAVFSSARDYLRLVAFSFPFMLAGRGMDVLILNDGDTRYSFRLNMMVTIVGLALNVFAVAVLKRGIRGLAEATVAASLLQFVGGVVHFAWRAKSLKPARPRVPFGDLKRVLANGSSDFVMMLVEAVMVFVVNRAFVRFLTPAHLEAYATVAIILPLIYSIFLGSAMGLQPVHSRLAGRGATGALRSSLRVSVLRGAIIGVAAYIAAAIGIEPILALFIDAPATAEHAKFFFVTVGAATLLSNLPMQATVFFTSINAPLESVVVSVVRTLLFIPVLSYTAIMYLGAWGVSVALGTTDVVLTVALLLYFRKQATPVARPVTARETP